MILANGQKLSLFSSAIQRYHTSQRNDVIWTGGSVAVAVFEWEEIANFITNELVDLFTMGDWLCKLLYNSCNETKYINSFVNSHFNKSYEKRLSSCGLQQDLLALSIWSIEKSRMLSQKNQLNLFHWLVTWVNYWIVSATTQNTFIALINRGVKK